MISPTTNPVAASFAVNVRLIVESLVAAPLLTPEVVDVIAIVGPTTSAAVKFRVVVSFMPAYELPLASSNAVAAIWR